MKLQHKHDLERTAAELGWAAVQSSDKLAETIRESTYILSSTMLVIAAVMIYVTFRRR